MTGGFGKIINGQGSVFMPKKGDPITNGWDWLSVPENEGNYFPFTYFNKRPNGSHWVEVLGNQEDVVDAW